LARDRRKQATQASTENARLTTSARIGRFFNSRVTISQLRTLAAIEELGQLKKAAAALNVTPPAVSKQLSELEDALQQKVLKRSGNRLEFTEVGALLLACGRQVLGQLERARIEVTEFCSGTGGKIGVGAVPSVAPVFLPDLVMDIRSWAPNTSIRLLESRFDRLAEALDGATLDVVLARYTGHQLSINFREEKVFSDPIVVVTGNDHYLAKRSTLAWKDLSGVPWILPPRGSDTFLHLENLIERHGLKLPPGCVESMSFSVNSALLQAYPFVALMPLAYARRLLNDKLIKRLPLTTGGIQDEIKAVWRKDNQNPMVSVLLEFIRSRARAL
jgi:DNA-binding transcriptional LysR family regulator